MKIKPEHLKVLETAINTFLKVYNIDNKLVKDYESGNFSKSDSMRDLQRRFCFDLMYMAGLTQFVCKELYPYMNDNHLYTALKTVCPKVIRKF